MLPYDKGLEEFHEQLIRDENISFTQARQIYSSLHKLAVDFGAISEATMLEGIEVDIRIAAILNGLHHV